MSAFFKSHGRIYRKNRKKVYRLDEHTDSVVSVTFSSDGRHFLSASKDRTARLWRLPDPPPRKK